MCGQGLVSCLDGSGCVARGLVVQAVWPGSSQLLGWFRLWPGSSQLCDRGGVGWLWPGSSQLCDRGLS